MRHDRGEAGFEAEASDQSRWCAGTGRRWTGSFAGGKRIRIRSFDHRRFAISEDHTQSTLRSWRRGNGRRQPCDVPSLRQGKRHRRLHAGGARLRLRWMSRLWRLRRMSWLRRRRMSRLWLQRLRLRRLRRLGHFLWRLWRFLGRLWFRRLISLNRLCWTTCDSSRPNSLRPPRRPSIIVWPLLIGPCAMRSPIPPVRLPEASIRRTSGEGPWASADRAS